MRSLSKEILLNFLRRIDVNGTFNMSTLVLVVESTIDNLVGCNSIVKLPSYQCIQL